MYTKIILIALMIIGCNGSSTLLGTGSGTLHTGICPLIIDYHFNVEETEVIINATRNWEMATKGMIVFNPKLSKGLEEPHHIIKEPYFTSMPDRNGQIHIHTASILEIDPLDYNENLRIIAAHELGHHLGISGHLTGNHIMNARPLNTSGKVTEEDVQLLNDIGYVCENYPLCQTECICEYDSLDN
jgi:hypothetical protein